MDKSLPFMCRCGLVMNYENIKEAILFNRFSYIDNSHLVIFEICKHHIWIKNITFSCLISTFTVGQGPHQVNVSHTRNSPLQHKNMLNQPTWLSTERLGKTHKLQAICCSPKELQPTSIHMKNMAIQ